MLNEFDGLIADNNLRFETAKISDIYLLQETLKRVYGKSPWSYTIFWSELIKKNTSRYIKAFQGEHYVGFIGMRLLDDEAHVTNIAVLPSFQNQGLGMLLLKEGEQFAIEKGVTKISLEVKTSNRQGVRLYEKYGFQAVGIKEGYYKESQEDAIEMVYQLGESND